MQLIRRYKYLNPSCIKWSALQNIKAVKASAWQILISCKDNLEAAFLLQTFLEEVKMRALQNLC